MPNNKPVTFSPEQQHALLGHLLQNQRVYDATSYLGYTDKLFYNANDQRIYAFVDKFWKRHHRYPTLTEVKTGELVQEKDEIVVRKTVEAIDRAITLSGSIGMDVVYQDLVTLKTSAMFVEALQNAEVSYNKQQVEEAIEKVREGLARIDHMSSLGLSAQARSGAEWYDIGIARVNATPERLLFTGISFLDEATCGLKPDDLMVVTSVTGYGKSQLMALMAYNMALQGRRVKLFALEAGKAEVETRIRFAKMLEIYYQRGGLGPIDYVEWSRGLRPDLEAYEPDPTEIKQVLSRVNITYKQTSKYGMEQLERDVFAVAREVDVILVDHLHYIDLGDKKSENQALTDIIQRIRDINLAIDRPVILAAHVRKHDGPRKEKAILPDIDDIYGSSNVSKNATWIVALGQPHNVDDEKVPIHLLRSTGHGAPTFVRFLKSRDGGGTRTAFTMVTFFSRGQYAPKYTIGRMSKADTKWTALAEEEFPPWAKAAFPLIVPKPSSKVS